MSGEGEDLQAEVLRAFYHDRRLAHRVLFAHRHPDASPPFHDAIVDEFHSKAANALFMAFRGGAKSTIAEEAICLRAGFQEFKNGLIVGSSLERAAERLHAIRYELENNELLTETFGPMVGPFWGEDSLVTASGIRIRAMGRGQSLRGIKHLDMRPDFVFVDDLEESKDVTTPEARRKVLRWFLYDLLPACDPKRKVRVAATPLDPEALPLLLSKTQGWQHHTHVYPAWHIDERGERVSSWPERFPMAVLNQIESDARRSATLSNFNAEYLCVAEAPEDKPFKGDMFKVEPRVRTWQAVYAMFDPARTTRESSATTGFAAWSWVGPKLIIWDSWGKQLMPDEIVKAVFDCNDQFSPVKIGVEEDGLNEFLMQPLRQEQVRRGGSVAPIEAMRAPRGKLDFIRALQPYFNAREVELAQPMFELKNQFCGFPTGKIDIPNALAYALKMRPGAPMYDGFSGARHVVEDLPKISGKPMWLALNATASLVTAALVQTNGETLRVYADWVVEGDPGQVLPKLVAEAQMEAARAVRLVAGPMHFSTYNNVGLRQAAARVPCDVTHGAPPGRGLAVIRERLKSETAGVPDVLVASAARWTANAFSGGYARAVVKGNTLADHAAEGPYRVLAEGLEALAGMLRFSSTDEDENGTAGNWAHTRDGVRYRSMLPTRRG